MWHFEGHAIAVWSPVIRDRKGTHSDLFRVLVEQGYTTGKINGREAEFEDPPTLEKNLRHNIDVIEETLLRTNLGSLEEGSIVNLERSISASSEIGDDPSIIGGLAKIDDIPVMIIGHEKGKGTDEKVKRNFGMPQPEGDRKSVV